MAEIMTFSQTFEIVSCSECGVYFAMTADFIAERRCDHRGFYCPNGHSCYYPAESREEKLARELRIAQQQIARAEDEARHATSMRLAAEKKLKQQTRRVAAGVCPCCNRTFRQLALHMARKHPEISQEAGHA